MGRWVGPRWVEREDPEVRRGWRAAGATQGRRDESDGKQRGTEHRDVRTPSGLDPAVSGQPAGPIVSIR